MHTSFMLSPEPPPLAADAQGVLRVGGTRVTFETVVGAFLDGATAEEIAEQYPVLPLAHVYALPATICANKKQRQRGSGSRTTSCFRPLAFVPGCLRGDAETRDQVPRRWAGRNLLGAMLSVPLARST